MNNIKVFGTGRASSSSGTAAAYSTVYQSVRILRSAAGSPERDAGARASDLLATQVLMYLGKCFPLATGAVYLGNPYAEAGLHPPTLEQSVPGYSPPLVGTPAGNPRL